MTFRGWAFALYGLIATLIYAAMGIRELRQRKRSGPLSPETDKVEGEFNRATWPLILGFILALFMSQPESGISAIWWVGVLVLAIALSGRSLISLRVQHRSSATKRTTRSWYRFQASLLERQALFFGALWIVGLLIYAFVFDDEEGKFYGHGSFDLDWPKMLNWALIPPTFAVAAAFIYERLVRSAKD